MVTWTPNATLSPLFCDKLSFTLGIPDDEHTQLEANLASLRATGRTRTVAVGGYTQSFRYYFESAHSGGVLLQCSPIESAPGAATKSFFRCEWNPQRCPAAGVRETFDHLLSGGFFRLITYGRCTRIDVSVDISGLSPDDLRIWHPKMVKSEAYFRAGKIETYYLGSQTSAKRVALYDKVAEAKRRKQQGHFWTDVPSGPTSRVEVRLRKDVRGDTLPTLANPFESIGVVGATLPTLAWEGFPLFREVFREQGAQRALALAPAGMQKSLRAWLKAQTCPWWDSQWLWGQWPAVWTKISGVDFAQAKLGTAPMGHASS